MSDPADAVDGPRSARPVRVFISYAHENDDHVKLVERVANVLAAKGMIVFLDSWRKRQRVDWNALTTAEIENSDYVVSVVSKSFHAAAKDKAPPGVHRAVRHEISVMRDLLQEDRDLWFHRLIPLVLEPWTVHDIPRFLQPTTATHVRAFEVSEHGLCDLIGLLSEARPDVNVPGRHRSVEPRRTERVRLRRRWPILAALVAVLIVGAAAVIQFGPLFTAHNAGANSATSSRPKATRSVPPPPPTSQPESSSSQPEKLPVSEAAPATTTTTSTATPSTLLPAPGPPPMEKGSSCIEFPSGVSPQWRQEALLSDGTAIGELVVYYEGVNGGIDSACFWHKGPAAGRPALTYVQIRLCVENSGTGQPCTTKGLVATDGPDNFPYYAGRVGKTGTDNVCTAAYGYIIWENVKYDVASNRQLC